MFNILFTIQSTFVRYLSMVLLLFKKKNTPLILIDPDGSIDLSEESKILKISKYMKDALTNSNSNDEESPFGIINQIKYPIAEFEIRDAVKQLKNYKACGYDGIYTNFIKSAIDKI